jgi:hypothetical protein
MTPECYESFHVDGTLKEREFWADGKRHNENGPAWEQWNATGRLIYCQFWVDGQEHNEAGPAYEWWADSGRLIYREYSVHGKRHNACGPAIEWWNSRGCCTHREFWVHGEKMTEDEFLALQMTKSAAKQQKKHRPYLFFSSIPFSVFSWGAERRALSAAPAG